MSFVFVGHLFFKHLIYIHSVTIVIELEPGYHLNEFLEEFVVVEDKAMIQYSILLFLFYSGTLVKNVGFEWMLVGIAILGFLYAPLLIFLRAPPTKEEKKVGDVSNSATTIDSIKTNGTISNEKNGVFNLALTTDDGVLAIPQHHINSNKIVAENCITKL